VGRFGYQSNNLIESIRDLRKYIEKSTSMSEEEKNKLIEILNEAWTQANTALLELESLDFELRGRLFVRKFMVEGLRNVLKKIGY
jgi:hypothetical protein